MSIFRIDTFNLPGAAREQFMNASSRTISQLRRQPGYVRDFWFEKIAGTGEINLITLVEWRDKECIDQAAKTVRELHAKAGFDATEFQKEHGIVEHKSLFVAANILEQNS